MRLYSNFKVTGQEMEWVEADKEKGIEKANWEPTGVDVVGMYQQPTQWFGTNYSLIRVAAHKIDKNSMSIYGSCGKPVWRGTQTMAKDRGDEKWEPKWTINNGETHLRETLEGSKYIQWLYFESVWIMYLKSWEGGLHYPRAHVKVGVTEPVVDGPGCTELSFIIVIV